MTLNWQFTLSFFKLNGCMILKKPCIVLLYKSEYDHSFELLEDEVYWDLLVALCLFEELSIEWAKEV
jgi:hypothetical protein